MKLLTDRHHKLNTPIAVRLKQQVQQHTGNMKNALPVAPKKKTIKPVRPVSHPAARPFIKSMGQQAFVKPAQSNRPMQKIRIVYVPTNQSASSLVSQGPVSPFYQKPIGQTPFIANGQKQVSSLRLPQAPIGKQLHEATRGSQKVAQRPMGGGLLRKPEPRKPIDVTRIFSTFPQLRENGVTEEILRDLNNRVPNLEERIQAHYNSHRIKPALYANSVHHDLAASNLAFMKNFHDAVESQKSKQSEDLFGSNVANNQGNIAFSGKMNSPSAGQNSPNKLPQVTAISDRLQSLALQTFQNNIFSKAKSQDMKLHSGGAGMEYKTPSDMSIQRFRQEKVPEAAYLNGNFEKQTNRPGMVLLPGDQLTSYGYNASLSRNILPQPIKYPMQTNRYASYYSEPQYRNSWTSFTTCSSTCGRGMKKRYRKCEIPDCPTGGVEIETVPCIHTPCAGKCHYAFLVSH